MDLLFREYASPFCLLDNLIKNRRFNAWVSEFLKRHKEKLQWEYYIHQVYDKTFKEYQKECDEKEKSIQELEMNLQMNDESVKATIKSSKNILNGFNPNNLERG